MKNSILETGSLFYVRHLQKEYERNGYWYRFIGILSDDADDGRVLVIESVENRKRFLVRPEWMQDAELTAVSENEELETDLPDLKASILRLVHASQKGFCAVVRETGGLGRVFGIPYKNLKPAKQKDEAHEI